MPRTHPENTLAGLARAARRLPVLAALALLAAPLPAAAGPHHGPPMGAMIDFHADELGLDAETREAIRAIVESSHATDRALREERRREERDLFELMEQDPVDRDALMERVERIGALRVQSEKHRIDTMLAIRERLSPEQRAALVELKEGMRRQHLGPILDACQDDLAARCEDGGPRGLHCLLRHREDLSEGCAAALEEMPHPFHHGPCAHGPKGPRGPGFGPFAPGGPPPGPEPLE